jgi:hypothetical protein
MHSNFWIHSVDGMLFINLNDEDWPDLGIVNKVHIRKLQLILKSYRYRYQQFKDKVEVDDDDDLVSEYSPSELSAMIRAEGLDYDESETDEDSQVTTYYMAPQCVVRRCNVPPCLSEYLRYLPCLWEYLSYLPPSQLPYQSVSMRLSIFLTTCAFYV